MGNNGSTNGKIKVHLGGDGIPFLTQKNGVPDYKHDFPHRLLPQPVRKAKTDILDLDNEEHYGYYSKIWDAVGLGVATVVDEERHWVPTKQNWKVLIRWYINGQMDPEELRNIRLQKIREMANPERGLPEEL